ncbi:HHR182Wp [Eremothecium sinecaudum]|uniref:HHR182Wp n=1 Tax=Eremothecium sinecaudum TaxID=45286 RepID=A0A109V0K5_9SACH|nr:HHR182Wp [Eremothecium sinecaudum]AMD22951.1 HHR182Wp [Eremothecium sinecaudum]
MNNLSFIYAVILFFIGLLASETYMKWFKTASSSALKKENIMNTKSEEAGKGGSISTGIDKLFEWNKGTTPVYFLSHGGPTFMYGDIDLGGDLGAFKTTQSIGKFIRNEIKPNFLIVVSAHWQSKGCNLVEISVPESAPDAEGSEGFSGLGRSDHQLADPLENKLIYDFYGFPDKLYKEEFHTRGNVALSKDIAKTINSSDDGLRAKLVRRGLDHGVWVPLKVAFSDSKPKDAYWDLDIPLVQVSLLGSDDFEAQYKLGQVLSKYRSMGGLVLTSGMSVHNLYHLQTMRTLKKAFPYVDQFHNTLRNIILTADNNGQKLNILNKTLSGLAAKELLAAAHPTLEHFMPIVVGLGAGEGITADDKYHISELYCAAVSSMGWMILQFGKYKD